MSADDISCELVIKRETYPGAWGSWRVRLDGQNVGRLGIGEFLTLRPSPGSHTVEVRSGVGSSSGPLRFEADAGGRIELAASVQRDTAITTRAVRLTREGTRASAAEIAIKRVGPFGSWQVRLDGEDVGRLGKGRSSFTLPVRPGSHTLVFDSTSRMQNARRPLFQFDAEAGRRIELAVQFAGDIGLWCSAASATPRAGTDVAGTVAEEARYEVPLGDEVRIIDNSQSASATTRVVRLTREWTRTSTVDLGKAVTTGGSVGIAMHVLDLKAAAERTLSEKYSVTTAERKAFAEEVTINVAPRTHGRVIFSWKEIRQKGVVQLDTRGGSQVRIPYEVVVGVTFDQQQIDDQEQ